MLFIQGESFTEIYLEIIKRVIERGRLVSPRGLPTLEICPAHLVLYNPCQRYLRITKRNINPAFAVAEAIWILSGSDDDWIYTFNKNLCRFADDNVLKGAYGPRIRRWQGHLDQLDAARKLLKRQPETRQAVIQIYDPAIDYKGYRDVACTLNHRFLIRDGYLDMYTTMRSQDVWLGMPYDVFSNTLLHELLAGWVECKIGNYHHRVDSLHLYSHDLKLAQEVELDSRTDYQDENESFQVDWSEFDQIVNDIILGKPVKNASWQSFNLIMQTYRAWKNGDIKTTTCCANQTKGWLGYKLRELCNIRE